MSDTPASDPVATSAATETATTYAFDDFIAAVHFLTRVTLTQRDLAKTTIQRSVVYFPLVGALIGAVSAGLLGLVMQLWPIWLAVVVMLACEALLTGALHEDAVADVCDALGGGWTTDEVLRILKDSRLGTYGVLGLVFAVTLRAGAIVELVGHDHLWAITFITAAAAGRLAMVLLMALLPPLPGRTSLASDMGRRVNKGQVRFAALWVLPGITFLAFHRPLASVMALIACGVGLLAFAGYLRQRIGGTTGDCLGAMGFAVQLLVLLSFAARWR